MTVPAAVTTFRYQGNGVTTVFAYSNRLLTTADVKVQILTRTTDAVVETLTLTTDYTVTIVSNSLANITITNASKIPSVTQDLLLTLNLAISQTRSYPRADSLPAADIEKGLDKLTLIAQKLNDGQTLTLRFPASDTTSNGELPPKADRLSKYLAFDSSGEPIASEGTDTITSAYGLTLVQAANAAAARTILEISYPGLIYGLTLSNNATDATNDIDIATGAAANDTAFATMTLASALTKRLDAAWAVGTGNGGLDTGSIANTTYHVWLIKRTDTGVVDALFSTSATSPTMPTSYDQKRRIGSIVRSAGAILAFVQNGDEFQWLTGIGDIDVTTPGTTAVSRTLTVPLGIKVVAFGSLLLSNGAAANGHRLYDLAVNTPSIGTGAAAIGQVRAVASGQTSGFVQVRTNTSAQIGSRNETANADIIRFTTYGWIDTRGK